MRISDWSSDVCSSDLPTVRLDHLTPEQIRAYRIADNRLAELSHFDNELLALELGALMEIDLEFDITVTGFDIGDIDFIIEGADQAEAGDTRDEVPEPKEQAVTRLGDIWKIGRAHV